MKRLLQILLFLLCFLYASLGKSQILDSLRTKILPRLDHYFGANVGAATGIGFSYRSWLDKNGGQITFLPIYDEVFSYSFGLSYLREIMHKNGKPRIIAFAGIHDTNFILGIGEITIVGAGMGVEETTDHLCISVMFGLGGYVTFYETKPCPLVEAGLFYNF